MQFNFNNYARPIGRQGKYEYFEWKVFMDESEEKLAQVRSVQYRLHETFPHPVREVADADSKFSLHSQGWGEFTIYIIVFLKNGAEEYEKYHLDLTKPWRSGDLVSEQIQPPQKPLKMTLLARIRVLLHL